MSIVKSITNCIMAPFRTSRKKELLNLTWLSAAQVAKFLSVSPVKTEAMLRNLAAENVIRCIGNTTIQGVHIAPRYALEDVMDVIDSTTVIPQHTTVRQTTKPTQKNHE